MDIYRTILGLLIAIFGIFVSYNLWFIDSASDASGVPALLCIWISSGLGLLIILWHVRHNKTLNWIPVIGAFATHMFMHVLMNLHKYKLLVTKGQVTFGVISFRNKVRRARTTSDEIRYTYYTEKSGYYKYDQSEEFINSNNLKIGDTLVIKYLPERPDWHVIVGVKTNYR